MLYCIEHESMVRPEQPILGHLVAIFNTDAPSEVDFCEFEMGWATCPPPEFDMDLFMETVEEPSWKEMAEASINGMSETEQW